MFVFTFQTQQQGLGGAGAAQGGPGMPPNPGMPQQVNILIVNLV